MAYNTKPIVTDVDGNPISQYYNPDTDQYEPVEGQAGANKVVLYNADGTENNELSLIPILDKLSQLTGTVIDEETRKTNELERIDNEDTRKSNELERIDNEDTRKSNEDIRIENENTRIENENIRKANEQNRIDLYNDLMEKVSTGYFDGKNLEFHWDGTKLGVRVEGETEYIYVDLKGETGDIENLTIQHVINALGYTPIKSVNNMVADETGNVELDIDMSEIENRIGNVENDLDAHKAEKASQIQLGHVKVDGTTIVADEDGVISAEIPDVDVSGKLDKSGDTILNYREKLVTLTGLTPNIDLSQANVFKLELEGATTLSISNPSEDVSQSLTLIVIQPAIPYTIIFPPSIKWMNGEIPDLSEGNKTYYLLLDTIDSGVTWHGRFGGMF